MFWDSMCMFNISLLPLRQNSEYHVHCFSTKSDQMKNSCFIVVIKVVLFKLQTNYLTEAIPISLFLLKWFLSD